MFAHLLLLSVLLFVSGDFYQFERQAFFVADRVDSSAEKLVFNRTVLLKEFKAPAPAAAAAKSAAKQAKALKPAVATAAK